MIQLINLTKKFGDFTAVNNLNIEIRQGEFYGILGPNGAGKTTTIKMMCGLFSPTSGRIIINGFDVQKNPLDAKISIGYIPDAPFLYDKLTGREYLYFSGGLYKIEKARLKTKIDELIELLDIGSWIDKRAEDYSRGMSQRIVIASALLHQPSVIIIDEPMVGLDPQSAATVKKILKQKSAEGISLFMSTHTLSVAEELCDRIGIIKDGSLIFEGSIDSINELKENNNKKLETLFLEITS
jgi:ABC-2 type transport system ATP-binding protein